MNIEKLKKYLETSIILANYKKVCEQLDEKVLTGNAKISQLKELERYFNFHKQGNKFVFTETYSEPKEKVDGRKYTKGNNRKEYSQFLIPREDENKIGIYKIVLDDNIYIGSTIDGFRNRFRNHNNEYSNNIPFTFDMLNDGATFEIIEICEGLQESQIRNIENKYIQQYREDKDWNLINSNDAWSYAKKQKFKTIKIQVKEEDYDKVLEFLKENNLI